MFSASGTKPGSDHLQWRWLAVSALVSMLALMASGACASDGHTSWSPAPTGSNWQDRVVSSAFMPEGPSSPEADAAYYLAQDLFDDHQDLWALNHFDADGNLVVNLTREGREELSAEVQRLQEHAPAPVEIREVQFSYDDLMMPTRRDEVGEIDFAGASFVSAHVDPERNELVIGLTEVTEASVAAAVDVFGDFVAVQQGTRVTQDVGTN